MRARVLRCVAPRCGRAVWCGDASCRGYAARIASRRTKGRRTRARARASARGRGGGTSACAPSTSALKVRRTLCSASAATASPRGRSPKPLCTGGALALAGDLLRPARARIGEARQLVRRGTALARIPPSPASCQCLSTYTSTVRHSAIFLPFLFVDNGRACMRFYVLLYCFFLRPFFLFFFLKCFGCILMVKGCSRMRGLWIQRTHTA